MGSVEALKRDIESIGFVLRPEGRIENHFVLHKKGGGYWYWVDSPDWVETVTIIRSRPTVTMDDFMEDIAVKVIIFRFLGREEFQDEYHYLPQQA
jgi:hypothetical protein